MQEFVTVPEVLHYDVQLYKFVIKVSIICKLFSFMLTLKFEIHKLN